MDRLLKRFEQGLAIYNLNNQKDEIKRPHDFSINNSYVSINKIFIPSYLNLLSKMGGEEILVVLEQCVPRMVK